MSEVGKLLIQTITDPSPAIRDRSVRELVARSSVADKLESCAELEHFRRARQNLYERVRASLFLHALYRYEIQDDPAIRGTGHIPFSGFMDLMERRYEPAIATFLETIKRDGPNGAICSALAQAYEQIAFATLADQVRRSVRSCQGNRWMFRVGGVDEHPLRIHPRLLDRASDEALFPILVEKTSVRLDLSHSGWSDIFFLGMDFPEGARVLNISVDLGVHGRDQAPTPPIETRLRVITEPILRLTSIDLNACKDIDTLEELFNFGNDYLGLIKAAVVASGLIPPSLEGTHTKLSDLLGRIVRAGHGLEVVSKVNDIPKGSRLAVSTNLLASLITLMMRATGQARNLTGRLDPEEAKVVVARAILGEWMGGSGGGWQDSGGIFPGIKLIEGVAAEAGDPEWGVSRGRLLPAHKLLNTASPLPSISSNAANPSPLADALAQSLVLVHGGMAQNVGPILNMVTAKYLLRGSDEWRARNEALEIFEQILASVRAADVRGLGGLTTRNWDGPLKQIIPWVTNAFTESIIREARQALGDDFWGFLMLGGMSGGGMAFFVAPHRHDEFQEQISAIMKRAKSSLDDALPFAMEPVVYDFRINTHGTLATLDSGAHAMMPPAYYTLQVPRMIAAGAATVPYHRRADVDHFANRCPETGELLRVFRTTINHLFPVTRSADDVSRAEWDRGGVTDSARQRLRLGPARTTARRLAARADRPGAKPAAGRPRHPGRRRLRAHRRDQSPSRIRDRERRISLAPGRGGCRDLGRRRWQPMDDRGGRGQGRQPVRQPRWPAPQFPGDPPRQNAKSEARLQRQYPAHRDHQLPDALCHRASSRVVEQLWSRRPSVPVAGPVDRATADSHGPRPDVPVGRGKPRNTR